MTDTATDIKVPKTDVAELTEAQLTSELDQLKAKLDEVSDEYEAKLAEYREVEEKYRRLQDRRSSDLSPLTRLMSDIKARLERIEGERLRRITPFERGDIVVDDQGVRYRVHRVVYRQSVDAYTPSGNRRAEPVKYEPGQVYGIRLTATGNEAYAKPREIVSSQPLTKVTPTKAEVEAVAEQADAQD